MGSTCMMIATELKIVIFAKFDILAQKSSSMLGNIRCLLASLRNEPGELS